MKLFLRENIMKWLWPLLAWGLVSLIVWLDGYQQVALLGYAGLLILLLSSVYWLRRYFLERSLYRLLEVGTGLPEARTPLGEQILRRRQQELDQLKLANKQLEEQQREQTDFMELWVHQMKTPLAVLTLLAESDDITKEEVLAETDRLQHGLQTALTLARLQDFSFDFLIRPLDPEALVKKAIAKQKRYFIRQGVFPKLTILSHESLLSDEKWLLLLLDQLLSNAIKYSSAGQQVELILKPQQIDVVDHGLGIPSSDQPRLFQRYYTGENGRKLGESTGMGLFLAQTIAQRLAVGITVQSKVGQGTTITLRFQDTKLD